MLKMIWLLFGQYWDFLFHHLVTLINNINNSKNGRSKDDSNSQTLAILFLTFSSSPRFDVLLSSIYENFISALFKTT